jgi:Protein of unknown function (DUF2742)
MQPKENRPAGNGAESSPDDTSKGNPQSSVRIVSSQQVSWWSVHEFVSAVLDQVDGWPMLGTPAWCSLAHDDPRKWAAVLDGGQHHALRLELNQEARADASRAVSQSVDWPALAREINQRADFYAARPWLRREIA